MSHYGFPPKFVNIIRQLYEDATCQGSQWTFSKQLEDLDFADDIALLSHKQQDAQEKLNRVAEEAEKTGLKINSARPKS
nr:hypothetical protein BaRGS_032970 [Batillaria attramentaria]